VIVVSNTSPIINLAAVGQFELLETRALQLAGEI
jgi:predicted nucleic acid-binding protein